MGETNMTYLDLWKFGKTNKTYQAQFGLCSLGMTKCDAFPDESDSPHQQVMRHGCGIHVVP